MGLRVRVRGAHDTFAHEGIAVASAQIQWRDEEADCHPTTSWVRSGH